MMKEFLQNFKLVKCMSITLMIVIFYHYFQIISRQGSSVSSLQVGARTPGKEVGMPGTLVTSRPTTIAPVPRMGAQSLRISKGPDGKLQITGLLPG